MHKEHPALPALLAVVLHLRTLRSGFTFDDRAAVRDNLDVFGQDRWSALLTHDFWGSPVRSELSHKSWRPLCVGLWRFVRLHTQPPAAHPAQPFHALNVVLHACVTWQLHALALRLASRGRHPQPSAAAFAAALLFAAHPVHCEAICGLVGASELLAAFLALTGLRCYACAAARASFLLLLPALLLALAAALSKESGITVLGAFIAYEWLLLAVPQQGDVPACLSRAVPRALAVVGTGAAYAALRRAVIGGDTLVRTWRISDNHLPFLPTRQARALSVAHSHYVYAKLLLLPTHLSADWNYACIPPVLKVSDSRNAGAALLYFLLIGLALWARPWRLSSSRAPVRVVLFVAAALGAMPLLPASNVLFFVGAYLAERLLYLPSAGFCILLGAALAAGRSAGRTLLACVVVAYCCRTAMRLPAWDSDATLFAATAATCPNGARAQYNAGVQLRLAGNCTGALRHYRAALAVLPEDSNCGPHYDIGLCAHTAGRLGEAVPHFENALRCIETATNAAEALAKTLSTLQIQFPTEPAVLLAYARAAPKLGVRERDACAAAGQAAVLLSARGESAQANTAVALCPLGPDAARKLARVPAALSLASACDSASPAAVQAHAAATDDAQRSSLAATFVARYGPACRGTSAYMRAVNALQTALPYSPELHAEWARLLRRMLSRDKEADTHMAFAASILDAHAASLGEVAGAPARKAAAALREEHAGWAGKMALPSPAVTQLVDTPLRIEL